MKNKRKQKIHSTPLNINYPILSQKMKITLNINLQLVLIRFNQITLTNKPKCID